VPTVLWPSLQFILPDVRSYQIVGRPVPVQVIDWKDSSPKWAVMCWWWR